MEIDSGKIPNILNFCLLEKIGGIYSYKKQNLIRKSSFKFFQLKKAYGKKYYNNDMNIAYFTKYFYNFYTNLQYNIFKKFSRKTSKKYS
jgi:hypothetical protein